MNISKHAYLIIAHANLYVLEKLIMLLDDERNDIYIHIDKKTKNFDLSFFQKLPQHSKLTFVKRIDVRWGHVSQIECELLLFRTAAENGDYSYYHLISGSDLPIKSQDHIHAFFLEHEGLEFVGFSDDKTDLEKVNKVHIFSKYQRVLPRQIGQRVGRKLRNIYLSIQRVIGYEYGNSENLQYVHGSNWVSITHQLATALVDRETWFLNFYKHSSCGDEIYKHTFIYNTDYKNRVYAMNDELKSSQRFMDWERGRPYTFRVEDYELIMDSEMLFARKFEDRVDVAIVDTIFSAIKAK